MNKKMTPAELEQFIHRELKALPVRKAPEGFAARFQAKLAANSQAATQVATAAVAAPATLEQVIGRELKALPLRKAPATLEARVLAAIEAQAMIPWYHKSWSYWPAAVRGAFLAVATSVAAFLIYLAYRAFASAGSSASAKAETVTAEFEERFAVVAQLYRVVMQMVDVGHHLISAIPPLWLYGGVAVAAFSYVTFFSLGAVAFRTLYRTSR